MQQLIKSACVQRLPPMYEKILAHEIMKYRNTANLRCGRRNSKDLHYVFLSPSGPIWNFLLVCYAGCYHSWSNPYPNTVPNGVDCTAYGKQMVRTIIETSNFTSRKYDPSLSSRDDTTLLNLVSGSYSLLFLPISSFALPFHFICLQKTLISVILLIPDPARLSWPRRTKTQCIGCVHWEASGPLFYLWSSKHWTQYGLFVCRNWMLKFFFIWWRQCNKGGRDYASLCVFVEAWIGEILCQMQQASLLEMNAASLASFRSLAAHSKLKLYQGRLRYLILLQLKVTNTTE